jgi:hypothetical protein
MQDEQVMAEVPRPERLSEPTDQNKEWRPSQQEALQEHEIRIRFLSRGCVVSVGCKEIAFEDVATAMQEINDYVCGGDTYGMQQKWRKLLNM